MRLMPPLLGLFLALCLAACAQQPLPRVPGPDGSAHAVTDRQELIVLTDRAPDILIGQARALGYALRAVHPLDNLRDTLVVLGIPDGTTVPQAIDQIETAVPGVTAGAHHVDGLQAGAADIASRDYAGPMIGWPPQGCRARRRVGLLDAGVGADHPGLRDGRITQQGFAASDAAPLSDHGTRMAELLIGPGRLRGTTLYSANVIDPGLGAGDAAGVVAILRGLDWLAANGVEVVNISLAGPRNKLLARAMERAAAQGMVLIAAVGNAGPAAAPQYPAAFPFVLAVTAVDSRGAVYRKAVRGAHVDIAAPGVDVMLAPGGRLVVSSGTSVTKGVATDPGLSRLTVEDLRAALARSARDMGAPGHDPVFGAGLLPPPRGC